MVWRSSSASRPRGDLRTPPPGHRWRRQTSDEPISPRYPSRHRDVQRPAVAMHQQQHRGIRRRGAFLSACSSSASTPARPAGDPPRRSRRRSRSRRSARARLSRSCSTTHDPSSGRRSSLLRQPRRQRAAGQPELRRGPLGRGLGALVQLPRAACDLRGQRHLLAVPHDLDRHVAVQLTSRPPGPRRSLQRLRPAIRPRPRHHVART